MEDQSADNPEEDLDHIHHQIETEIIPAAASQAVHSLRVIMRDNPDVQIASRAMIQQLITKKQAARKGLRATRSLSKSMHRQYRNRLTEKEAVAVVNMLRTQRKMVITSLSAEAALALQEIHKIDRQIDKINECDEQLSKDKPTENC